MSSIDAHVSWPDAPFTNRLVRDALQHIHEIDKFVTSPSEYTGRNKNKLLLQWSTYDAIDHNLTSPSPPPVAILTAELVCPNVADGCQAAPPMRSECPRLVDTSLRLGRSQILDDPVHEDVRRSFELGEKRMVERGRSSPN